TQDHRVVFLLDGWDHPIVSPPITTGSWHHVAARVGQEGEVGTAGGTIMVSLFMDGNRVEGPYPAQSRAPMYGDTQIPLTVGTFFPYGPASNYPTSPFQGSFSFKGLIEQPAIYNWALSDEEIRLLAAGH